MTAAFFPVSWPRGLHVRQKVAAALLVLVLGAAPAAAAGSGGELPGSFAPLVERVAPAVVAITVSRTATKADALLSGAGDLARRFGLPLGDNEPSRSGGVQGSGFLVDADGTVVTNNHVVDGAVEILVSLSDGARVPAVVVGRDPRSDLAVLKIKADRKLPFLEFGDSDRAKVGDWVIAVGNPFGLGGTVTAGIVSGRARDIKAGPYDDFIQTDAAINQGNSGGPMFNRGGEVIGVNTAIVSLAGGFVGIGFAIPSNLARGVVADLKDKGRVERGWLGVRIQEVTRAVAEGLGMDRPRGVLVADVTDGGPAAVAGLMAGDVVVSFGGRPVEGTRDLPRRVAESRPGAQVRVEVMRQGMTRTLTVHMERQPDDVAALSGDKRAGDKAAADKAAGPVPEDVLGMKLIVLDEATRRRQGLADGVAGVLVTGLSSSRATATMQAGDVIVQVGDAAVSTPADVGRRVGEAEGAGQGSVLLRVNRRGTEMYVALKLGPE
jgi:serine protease Do